MNLDLQKPHITYPCEWEYRIIGQSEEELCALVFEIMPREYRIERGKSSSGGNFVSMYVWVVVNDEDERNTLFGALQAHKDVKMVL